MAAAAAAVTDLIQAADILEQLKRAAAGEQRRWNDMMSPLLETTQQAHADDVDAGTMEP